jgi:hypothetical protein
VLVYRDDRRAADTATELRILVERQRVAEGGSEDDALAVLITAGEVESAICDALFATADAVEERTAALRAVSIAAARQYLRTACTDSARTVGGAIDGLTELAFPQTIEMRPSEGYAYYALFPETYAASARRLREDLKPRRACVIGIRSIGTSLSAVVAAALQPAMDVSTFTVRPRGHPFDRHVAIQPTLRDAWLRELALDAVFAIVDEGPGMSGSSFASVVCVLRDLGVPSNRIVLLPSWDPPPDQLRSETARAVWSAHRRYVTSALECNVTPERSLGSRQCGVDWSAGSWRAHVAMPESRWPAVQPQHERWKVSLPGEGRLLKFAGLGAYGAAAFERLRRVSASGMTQAATQLRRGFIDLTFIEGAVATPPFPDEEAETVGRYIGLRAAEFGDAPSDGRAIAEMTRTNVQELRTDEGPMPAAVLSRIHAVFESAPASDIDGRMLPYEWIRTPAGLMKVDVFEHGGDHFFPGAQNPAWDLAGASLELELSDTGVRRMLDAYKHASGDARAHERMSVYRLAYAAFRAGYAATAADALAGSAEGERFARVLARFRKHLRRLIPSVL